MNALPLLAQRSRPHQPPAARDPSRGRELTKKLPVRLSWTSIRPGENRYRFYALSIEPDLWGSTCVIRRWGRLTGGSKAKFTWVDSDEELHAWVRRIHRHRLLHGYRLTHGDPRLLDR